MNRESLFRRSSEAAFLLLFGAGLVLGGSAALAGIPMFIDAALPGMAARASAEDGFAHGVARFAVPQGFDESRFAPQVLYPVTQNPLPEWLSRAVLASRAGPPLMPRGMHEQFAQIAQPMIAICIDDLGEDLAGTHKAMALPRAVALSFLPYAKTTPFLADAAARQGHLVLAHVPMEAVGSHDPGPMVLKSSMAADEIARRLGWNLARVPGLVGINNHEGSRFTADAAALRPVMATLKARHLFFFDSRTGPDSVAGAVAHGQGVMTGGRDIFLDDDPSPPAVSAELELLAREAKRNGVAIAIGHPHEVTLRLLAAWLGHDHGVTLVTLDEAIRRKEGREVAIPPR
jgi:polysaccharide deacetylase 2 family uncharacterized protein YibQ